jgi:hypothetical protein
LSGSTIDDCRDERHPLGAAAAVIGVFSIRRRRYCGTAVDAPDAVDGLASDATE